MADSQTVAYQSQLISSIPALTVDLVNDPTQPTFQPDSYKRMAPLWQKCRDVYAIPEGRLQEKALTYLPKWPLETDANYDQRRRLMFPLEAYGRAVRGMSGLLTAEDVTLGNDVPEAIRQHWEDIDLHGTRGTVFASNYIQDGMITGFAGILVDYPPVYTAPGERLTSLQELELGLRPYWCHYVAEDIWHVRYRRDPLGSAYLIDLLVLHELAPVSRGLYGEVMGHQWRVFSRTIQWSADQQKFLPVVTAQIFRLVAEGNNKATLVPGPMNILSVPQITFALTLFGHKVSTTETRPPLLGVADKNIQHTICDTDLMYVLEKASMPTMVITGASRESKEDPVAVGPNVVIHVPMGAEVHWMEFAGTSAEKLTAAKKDYENDMANLAMAFLQRETRAAETAEGKRIDHAGQGASLGQIAVRAEDTFELCLQFHALYMSLESGGSCTVNREYLEWALQASDVGQYTAMQTNNQISLDTLWDVLERKKWLPKGFDHTAEKTRLLASINADREMGGESGPSD